MVLSQALCLSARGHFRVEAACLSISLYFSTTASSSMVTQIQQIPKITSVTVLRNSHRLGVRWESHCTDKYVFSLHLLCLFGYFISSSPTVEVIAINTDIRFKWIFFAGNLVCNRMIFCVCGNQTGKFKCSMKGIFSSHEVNGIPGVLKSSVTYHSLRINPSFS